MKLVKLYDTDKRFRSKGVLRDALNMSPKKELTIADMVARCKVMRCLANAEGDLVLEDADHKALLDAVEAFPWAVADEALLEILQAVKDAPKAPAGMLPTDDAKPAADAAIAA